MDFIFLIVSSIIILACFYFIVSPFFTGKAEVKEGNISEEDTLSIEAVYGAVNELEMDYLMKKISEEDYMSLKEQYQLLAANLMKQGEKKTRNVPKDNAQSDKAELELLAQLQKLRKQKGR